MDAGTLRDAIVGVLPDMRAFARLLVRDPARADDLVQDAVLRALANADKFESGTNLKAWLFTIQRNAFLQQVRARKREDAALSATPASEEAVAPATAEIGELGRLLDRLSPVLREALILVGASEMTHEEAALVCGVPPGTMRARVTRARQALARLYAQTQDAQAQADDTDLSAAHSHPRVA